MGAVKFPKLLRSKHQSLAADLPVWMDPIEFSQVTAVIEAVAPRNFLEWGSGGSTRALLENCPFVERYVSIEHDPLWHGQVSARIRDPRLSLHLVPADVPTPDPKSHKTIKADWNLRAETDASMMRTYVGFPRTLGLQFQLVLVDGRARTFCLREGFDLLAPNGVLLLHDAQRSEYHETMRSLGRAVFLTPWKQGQVCLLRKP
jgi:hypothetical protein